MTQASQGARAAWPAEGRQGRTAASSKSKTHLKWRSRRRTTYGDEEAMTEVSWRLPTAQDCGEALIGTRIRIWWDGDRTFYDGKVVT